MAGVLRLAAAILVALAVALVMPRAVDQRMRTLADGPSVSTRWSTAVERMRRRARPGAGHRRRQAADRMRTVHGLSALAAELEAGQPPALALQRCADEPPLWPRTLAALAVDADVPAALREDGRERAPLVQLAACWQVAAESGAGLAASVSGVASSARTAEDTRVALEAELAGPRSTARLLSALPLVGVGFGMMMGVSPAAWLIGTSIGQGCLTVALGLIGLGTWWTGRIAAGVEKQL